MAHDAKLKLEVYRHYLNCRSVSDTCAAFNIARQTLYNWIDRFETEGEAGLVDKSRAHKSHPLTTPADTVQHIVRLAYDHPALGGASLAKLITPPHAPVSAQTINGLLRSAGLTTPDERWLALERQMHALPSLTDWKSPWVTHLVKRNPRYLDWDMRDWNRDKLDTKPGEAITFGVLVIDSVPCLPLIAMACVVDTFSSNAFAKLFMSRRSVNAVEVLEQATQVYTALGYKTSRIRIHRGSLPSPSQWHRLRDYLKASDVTQGTKLDLETRNRRGEDFWGLKRQRSGFTLHFGMMVHEGYFGKLDRRRNPSFEELQVGLDEWVASYNDSGNLLGYPTMGKSPKQMIAAARAAAVVAV